MNFTNQVAWPEFCGREQGDTYCKKPGRMSNPIIPFIMPTIIKHKQSYGTESTNENISHGSVVIMANSSLNIRKAPSIKVNGNSMPIHPIAFRKTKYE